MYTSLNTSFKSAMASKVITRAVQYCSSELKALRDFHKQAALKLKVDNAVWNTLGNLDIRINVRGCRGGVRKQRPIQQIQALTRIPYPTKQTIGVNTSNLRILTHPAINNQTIPVIENNRPHQLLEAGAQGCNHNNIISVPCKKEKTVYRHEKLQVGYLNARSVKNDSKPQEVSDFIIENHLDILALTETWLRPGDTDNIVIGDLTPAGYNFLHVPRPTGGGKKGGGVAVVVKSNLKTTVGKVTKFNSFEVIEVTALSTKDCIRVSVVYRPPSQSKIEFIDEFHKYLDGLATSKGKLIVIGDFNFHFEMENNADAMKLRELLYSMDIDQHVHGPTQIRGHTLDLVLTRSSEAIVQNLHVHPAVISDHSPITFSLLTKRPSPERKLISFRKLKKIDMVKFKEDIKNSPIVQAPVDSNVDDLVKQYNDTLTNILDQHAPLVTKHMRDKSEAPWYNEQVLEAKRLKRRAERKYNKTKLTVHLEILRDVRSKLNNTCRLAK